MNRKLMGLFVGLVFALNTSFTHATAIYTYVGNNFDSFVGPFFDGDGPSAVYGTDDQITGTVQFSTALGALFDDIADPLSFSFFDGVNVISTTNATSRYFYFKTDASANIISWAFNVKDVLLVPNGHYREMTVNAVLSFDYASDTLCASNAPVGSCFPEPDDRTDWYTQRAQVDSVGSWAVSQVPEPTTLALMGLGLAGIGWKRRKAA